MWQCFPIKKSPGLDIKSTNGAVVRQRAASPTKTCISNLIQGSGRQFLHQRGSWKADWLVWPFMFTFVIYDLLLWTRHGVFAKKWKCLERSAAVDNLPSKNPPSRLNKSLMSDNLHLASKSEQKLISNNQVSNSIHKPLESFHLAPNVVTSFIAS